MLTPPNCTLPVALTEPPEAEDDGLVAADEDATDDDIVVG